MNLKDIVKVDANFQKSINLILDYENESLVDSYIPTTTGMDFLEHFLSNILDSNGNHSAMMIAPYGKGKSHAVLVLLTLLKLNDYSGISNLIHKIAHINCGLYEKICEIQKKKYFPIIISSTRGTLNQGLLYSINKCLINAGINDLLIENDFVEVIKRIKTWKKDYVHTYEAFLNLLQREKISYNTFIKHINAYDETYLSIFKKIHREILSGAEFSTHSSLEVVEYYQQVINALVNNYNYDGVYIVFDEFSKFLESRDETSISNDMKIIQDLAELCNNTKSNSYLHLIMHKPISHYLSVDLKVKNAFKGIEGRVESYYFVSSLKNSFDLVSNVLVKTKEYKRVEKELENMFSTIHKKITKLPAFYSNFEEKYLEKEIVRACYPLHPISVYLLVKINEKVAQNERTLFTFLAKNTDYSLPRFLLDNDSTIMLADSIFDYFRDQLLNEKDNIIIHKITSSCMSALRNNLNDLEIKLLKVLSLLLIINEKDMLPSNCSVIASSLMIENSECERLVEQLIEKGILVQRYGGIIQFKVNMDFNVNTHVQNLIETKFSKINVSKELSLMLDTRYVYPRTYNIANKITRYYQVEYISEKDFLDLKSVDIFFKEYQTDGLILNIIRDIEESNEIKNKVATINNDLLIAVYPSYFHDYEPFIKKYLAIKYLINDASFIENNSLVVAELELLLDDTKLAIENLLEIDFSINSDSVHIFNSFNHFELNENKRNISKNRILGDIFRNAYNAYPNTINLELINKHNVKGTYKKARENVIQGILDGTIAFDNLGTSPEDTIVNCIFVETGLKDSKESNELSNVISIINEFLVKDNSNFSILYNLLTTKPVGLREGVIPLFLAWCIRKLNSCVLIKYKEQEVELTAQVLEEINVNPADYSFIIDEMNVGKYKYIEDLAQIFHVNTSQDLSKTYFQLFIDIRKWYVSLPKFTKQMIGNDGAISDKKYKLLKKYLTKVSCNASEFIVKSLPKIFTKEESFDNVTKELILVKENLDNYCNEALEKLKKEINQLLGFEPETIVTQSLNYWINMNGCKLEKLVLEDSVKNFIKICHNSTNDTESILINKLCYCLTGLFVEDWSVDTHDVFISQLDKIISLVCEDEQGQSNSITLKFDGKTIVKAFDEDLDDSVELIENFIDSTIEDYGDLLSNEQKISLLVRIMKKYL